MQGVPSQVRAIVFGTLWAVVVSACDFAVPPNAPRHPVRIDLVGLLPFTGHQEPTASIEPGLLAARQALGRGWGVPRALPDGGSGAPIAARAAVVWFEAGPVPVDRELEITQRRVGEGPARRVAGGLRVEVNGARCPRLRNSRAESSVYRVPAALQRPGRNSLTLRGGRRRPGDPSGPVILVTKISLRATGPTPPLVRAAGDRLELPAGGAITFYVRAPSAPRLEFGTGGGPVQVVLLRDGHPPAPIASGASLRADEHEIVGVRFESSAGGAVVRPAVRGTTALPGQAALPHDPAGPARRPNVLVYVADTLRADRLGCYGSSAGLSPHLDRLAGESVVFEQAISPSSWTRPATASLLTGVAPARHGASTLRDRIARGVPTLAERLRQVGYGTAAIVTNVNVAPVFGFGRGFDTFEYLEEREDDPVRHVPADRVHAAALRWLDARHEGAPFFLYLHVTDVHAPYRPSTGQRERVAGDVSADAVDALLERLGDGSSALDPAAIRDLSALYDGEIADLDASFGRFWQGLVERGFDRDTLVVFTADHGEEFLDHGGVEHGYTLYQEAVRVPLLLRMPGARGGGRRVLAFVRLLDIAPTIALLTGADASFASAGVPLVMPNGALPQAQTEHAVTSTEFGRTPVEAVVVPPWKVIFPPPGRRTTPEVYDLSRDPKEGRDLSAARLVLIGYARQVLAMERTQGEVAVNEEAPALAPDLAARLRRLGYVPD